MKKAIIILVLSCAAFILVFIGCNDSNGIVPDWSHPIVKECRIGNVPIIAGGTFDVPLGEVNLMTFVLNQNVDAVTFVEFLDIKITIFNQDTNQYLILTRNTMLENGSFYVGQNSQYVEYRLLHYMDRVWIGGVPIDNPPFASPGDTLEVKLDYVSGRNAAGAWFNFHLDTFKIVFSTSTP